MDLEGEVLRVLGDGGTTEMARAVLAWHRAKVAQLSVVSTNDVSGCAPTGRPATSPGVPVSPLTAVAGAPGQDTPATAVRSSNGRGVLSPYLDDPIPLHELGGFAEAADTLGIRPQALQQRVARAPFNQGTARSQPVPAEIWRVRATPLYDLRAVRAMVGN